MLRGAVCIPHMDYGRKGKERTGASRGSPHLPSNMTRCLLTAGDMLSSFVTSLGSCEAVLSKAGKFCRCKAPCANNDWELVCREGAAMCACQVHRERSPGGCLWQLGRLGELGGLCTVL